MRTANAQTMPVPLTGLGPDWTGPGGIGDYARSNGNTHEVVNAAHAMRNGDYANWLRLEVKDPGLADEVAAIAADGALSPPESRAKIRTAVEKRYTLPADKATGVVDTPAAFAPATAAGR